MKPRGRRPSGRQWLVSLLIVAGLWLVVSRLTELRQLADTLARGDVRWVLAAAGAQSLYFVVFASLFATAFSLVGVRSSAGQMLPLLFLSNFASLFVPTSGNAVFIDDAGRRGQSPARATAGLLVVRATDYLAFGVITAVGIAYLFTHHDLAAYEVLGAVALVLVVAAQMALLTVGLWQPAGLRRLLALARRLAVAAAGRAGRRAPVPEDWPDRTAADFAAAAAAVATHRTVMLRAIVLGVVMQLLDLATLFALFAAFGERVGPGVLVAGYAAGVLFLMVPITPQGVGVVEGTMVLVYASLGVPTASATIVSLAFRGLSLWLPVAAGFLLLRRLSARVGPPDDRTSA